MYHTTFIEKREKQPNHLVTKKAFDKVQHPLTKKLRKLERRKLQQYNKEHL